MEFRNDSRPNHPSAALRSAMPVFGERSRSWLSDGADHG